MKKITIKQLKNKKYENKFLNTYFLHYEKKDKQGNWITLIEVRGVSKVEKENYETPRAILKRLEGLK